MFLGSSANTPIASSMPESRLLPAQTIASETTRTLDLSSPSVTLPRGGMPTMVVGNKRKQTDTIDDELDGTVATQTNGVTKEIQGVPSVLRPAIVSPATGVSQVRLGVPKVMSHFDYSPGEKSGVLLEARNGAGQSIPSRLTLSKGKTILWVDYVPRAVLEQDWTKTFNANYPRSSTMLFRVPRKLHAVHNVSRNVAYMVVSQN
jgi:protein HIRA/HIR1